MQNIKCQKRGGSMIYKYNKLVRDKIPEEIENQGKECKYEILDDEKYSKELDKKLLEENNYVIGNIDATIICQKPKLAPFREQMVKNVADALNINANQVCIKATTEEGLGFTGEGLGISSQAIVLLEENIHNR